ncbi:MAG TPA: SDR family oxidoreductase, partial [Acetobacteraceae bacterium]
MGELKPLFDLSGRVALVTGGSRGLGLQIAEGLGEYGAAIALASRKQGDLDEAVAQLAGRGIAAYGIAADLRGPEAAAALAAEVMQRSGRIDILVNNAGATWGAAAEDHTQDAWRRVMDLNVDGLFYLCQAVARAWMIPNRKGRIVNIASVAGLKGNSGTIAYNTSKGAVVNLTRALGVEWGQHGITVNAIAPGWFPSRMTRATLERSGEDFAARTPLRKLGGPDDLKGAALLFASDAGGHITGQILAIDG